MILHSNRVLRGVERNVFSDCRKPYLSDIAESGQTVGIALGPVICLRKLSVCFLLCGKLRTGNSARDESGEILGYPRERGGFFGGSKIYFSLNFNALGGENGGVEGIRTLETLPSAPLAGVCLRPLGHHSADPFTERGVWGQGGMRAAGRLSCRAFFPAMADGKRVGSAD
jgi:hypothetical protein